MVIIEKTKVRRRYPQWCFYAALVFVIVMWGMDPTVNSYLYNYYSATALSVISTFVSLVLFVALSAKKIKRLNKTYLKIAVPISSLNAAACLLQRIGLQYTTPASYAFLEHLSCVVVPIMMFVLVRKKPTKAGALSSAGCLVGCFVLSGLDFQNGGLEFSVGELLCAAAGVVLGIGIAATGVFTQKLDITLYMVIHMFMYFIISVLGAVLLNAISVNGRPLEAFKFSSDPRLLAVAAVFGIVTVGVCWVLRNAATRRIDPVIIAVSSPFSAVITGVVSVCLGMDELSLNLVLGSSMIFVAVSLSGISSFVRSKT